MCFLCVLQNSTLTIEEFHSKLQEATNFPLRPFVVPFLKVGTWIWNDYSRFVCLSDQIWKTFRQPGSRCACLSLWYLSIVCLFFGVSLHFSYLFLLIIYSAIFLLYKYLLYNLSIELIFKETYSTCIILLLLSALFSHQFIIYIFSHYH